MTTRQSITNTIARIVGAASLVAVDISSADQTLDTPPKGLWINLATEGVAGVLTLIGWHDSDAATLSVPASGVYPIVPRQINTGATGIGTIYALY